MKHRLVRVVVVVAGVLLLLVVGRVVLRDRAPRKPVLSSELATFLEILPADVTIEQREEIEGILARFEARARAGEIAPDVEHAVLAEIRRYRDAGSIETQELYRLMAMVSTAEHGMNLEHPLLEPASRDSTP